MRWQSFLHILPGKKIIALFHTTNIKNMISLIKRFTESNTQYCFIKLRTVSKKLNKILLTKDNYGKRSGCRRTKRRT